MGYQMKSLFDELQTGLQQAIAFEQTKGFGDAEDPFFSEENISELERRAEDIAAGKNVPQLHELIEAD